MNSIELKKKKKEFFMLLDRKLGETVEKFGQFVGVACSSCPLVVVELNDYHSKVVCYRKRVLFFSWGY